ncbi:MAG: hypothetical protein JWP59_3446 [Massilia sp.]|nr:hypothetical protein [Massilia sp.]
MQMVATDTTHFPLVDLRAVSNGADQWVAISARLVDSDDNGDSGIADSGIAAGAAAAGNDGVQPASAWQAVFEGNDLLTAIAPLDCIVHLRSVKLLSAPLVARLPASRVLFAVDVGALDEDDAVRQLSGLQQAGYRVLVDGATGAGTVLPPTLRAIAHDCADPLTFAAPLAAVFGPHLAHGVDTPALFDACGQAGFAWFSGDYALQASALADHADAAEDGLTARRLLKLLGLLLTDADTRVIETQLKQDPALCYHLLRLVNSAAFAPPTPIHDFAQAIDHLGRRQLLRWLQLLLYARPRADGLINPLLPIAARCAAQIESLCKQHGYGRDEQDLAFQVGVFSLLDVLLRIPMAEIVSALMLPPDLAGALLERSGVLGRLLALVEASGVATSGVATSRVVTSGVVTSGVVTSGVATPAAAAALLAAAGVTPQQWWRSQLHAFHWAIQVSRNL